MLIVIRNGRVVRNGSESLADVVVRDGLVESVRPDAAEEYVGEKVDCLIDASGCLVMPALADVHVHFREPGNPEKETVLTGSKAAAHGGYSAVCTMPNLDPAPDSPDNIRVEQTLIDESAVIDVLPFSTITKGRKGLETVDYAAMKPLCIGFSDDGSGVQDEGVMRAAMKGIASVDSILSAHCEDVRYGDAPQSEWSEIERDLRLAEETGCRYHVCHISSARSVELIRAAKARGVNVTCETAPHYLTLCDAEIEDDGRFKMNPPLRSADDRAALIEGIVDGTIDVIATDHAPHTAEQKSKGFCGSANGIVGLETAFPVIYTRLVKTGIITPAKAVELMSESPRRIFGIDGGLREGEKAEIAVFDITDEYRIDSSSFETKGRSTPFEGWSVSGRCIAVIHNGRIVYKSDNRI